MNLKDTMGISGIKICPDCGSMGPRLINRCETCEASHQEEERKRINREADENKIAQRRANGFGPEWDI